LPAASRKRVLTEPIGRNTAAAIALAAIHIRHAAKGDALMAVLPRTITSGSLRISQYLAAALNVAKNPAAWSSSAFRDAPETGFGYVERMGASLDSNGFPVFVVRRFTEKPALPSRKICRQRQLSLECRHVLLARLDVPRQSPAPSPKTPLISKARCIHRHARL